MVFSREYLHFNYSLLSLNRHLPSYDSLTTLLINLTMKETHSGIDNQSRRQVNKGVLETTFRHPCYHHKDRSKRRPFVNPLYTRMRYGSVVNVLETVEYYAMQSITKKNIANFVKI